MVLPSAYETPTNFNDLHGSDPGPQAAACGAPTMVSNSAWLTQAVAHSLVLSWPPSSNSSIGILSWTQRCIMANRRNTLTFAFSAVADIRDTISREDPSLSGPVMALVYCGSISTTSIGSPASQSSPAAIAAVTSSGL